MTQNDDNTPQNPSPSFEEMEKMVENNEEKNDAPKVGDATKIAQLEEQIALLQEKLLRTQADQQNMLKRLERERQEMGNYFTQNIAKKLLPIMDDFERALAALPEDIASHSWIEGIRGVYASSQKRFEGLGIAAFSSIGNEVDVQKHEVVSQGPGEKDKIILEFEKGYLLGDQVLRPAKVVIGNGE